MENHNVFIKQDNLFGHGIFNQNNARDMLNNFLNSDFSHEFTALQALMSLENAVYMYGLPLQLEIGKFRFLNELMKFLTPEHNGVSPRVKEKIVSLFYKWSQEFENPTKVKEICDNLKKLGVIFLNDPEVINKRQEANATKELAIEPRINKGHKTYKEVPSDINNEQRFTDYSTIQQLQEIVGDFNIKQILIEEPRINKDNKIYRTPSSTNYKQEFAKQNPRQQLQERVVDREIQQKLVTRPSLVDCHQMSERSSSGINYKQGFTEQNIRPQPQERVAGREIQQKLVKRPSLIDCHQVSEGPYRGINYEQKFSEQTPRPQSQERVADREIQQKLVKRPSLVDCRQMSEDPSRGINYEQNPRPQSQERVADCEIQQTLVKRPSLIDCRQVSEGPYRGINYEQRFSEQNPRPQSQERVADWEIQKKLVKRPSLVDCRQMCEASRGINYNQRFAEENPRQQSQENFADCEIQQKQVKRLVDSRQMSDGPSRDKNFGQGFTDYSSMQQLQERVTGPQIQQDIIYEQELSKQNPRQKLQGRFADFKIQLRPELGEDRPHEGPSRDKKCEQGFTEYTPKLQLQERVTGPQIQQDMNYQLEFPKHSPMQQLQKGIVGLNMQQNKNYKKSFAGNPSMKQLQKNVDGPDMQQKLVKSPGLGESRQVYNEPSRASNLGQKRIEYSHMQQLQERVPDPKPQLNLVKRPESAEGRQGSNRDINYERTVAARDMEQPLQSPLAYKDATHQPSCNLSLSKIPKNKKQQEIMNELSQLTRGLRDVVVPINSNEPNVDNPGFCFLNYESHQAAYKALNFLRHWHCSTIWGQKVIVNWAGPEDNLYENAEKDQLHPNNASCKPLMLSKPTVPNSSHQMSAFSKEPLQRIARPDGIYCLSHAIAQDKHLDKETFRVSVGNRDITLSGSDKDYLLGASNYVMGYMQDKLKSSQLPANTNNSRPNSGQ